MRKEQIAKGYRRQGLTYPDIARLMGVSETWAWYLCHDEARARFARKSSVYTSTSGTCVDCGGQMTKNTHQMNARGKRMERCRSCHLKHRSRESFNARVVGETLKCGICHEFLPFHAFPQGMLQRFLERGKGASPNCRACDTAARVAYRERQKHPCAGCGKPRLGDDAGRVVDTGLCVVCFNESRRKQGVLVGRQA